MEVTPQDLRNVSAISEVPEDQLQWLIDNSRLESIPKGGFIFQKGDAIDKLFILLEGEVDVKVDQNGNYKQVAKIRTNEISGALPYSRATTAIGFGETTRNAKALILPKEAFNELTRNHFELTEALVHVMTSRTREFAKRNVQEEKMMALGKLSAGLAHELNNPSSAMARSAVALKKHLGNVPEKFKRIISVKATPEQIDVINDTLFEKLTHRPENTMGLLERTEKEEVLETWLEDHQVENAYELTETLLDFCMDVDALERIYTAIGDRNFPTAIEWIENVLTTEKMVDEIQEAAQRISTLVSSVKSYTHMDSAPERTATDIRKGIKSTLTMMNHKLKQKGIVVEKYFEEELPEPKIMVSEINQVWTNLIDNAVDAMDQQGRLTIKVNRDGNFIKTEIIDNGEGIPKENLSTIFDPFFTTKPIGEGTGMGLEVVKRIIQQHNGDIKVSSRKGETNFTVCLPIE
ncbi:cyclic nucleotide-binding domain-containing protein [Flavobacteriaceae bacterium TP-CH-4]|uniref:histidine kinase n=1 Tax=Pelagihabitans pacificus TaxID=2696054 RepID=A0A967EBE9_9FLAO|nr:ATP-binding protein [Pelagihabitans pacificus]NHF60271.1 cyclic nucleotide-binding domain-containing protein [Pelagihabitans pacificus]